jgi:hypothetical protein
MQIIEITILESDENVAFTLKRTSKDSSERETKLAEGFYKIIAEVIQYGQETTK